MTQPGTRPRALHVRPFGSSRPECPEIPTVLCCLPWATADKSLLEALEGTQYFPPVMGTLLVMGWHILFLDAF